MASPQLDRLLETCKQNSEELLLAAGSPPLLRGKFGLRSLTLPPLTAADMGALIEDMKHHVEHFREKDGYTDFDLRYDDECFFRTSIFVQVSPPVVLMIKLQVPPAQTIPVDV